MSAAPRVLLLTGSLGPGGTELAVVAMAEGLARRGRVAPRVALLGTGGALGARLAAGGIPVDELDIRGPLRRPAALRRLLSLGRLVREERVDVVHTFLFDADFYGMLAARRGRPRAIVTTRRALKSHRPGHLRGYRWTNRLVDRIVANSEAVRRFTIDVERAPAAKVVAIPNGVDTVRFAGGDRAAARARLEVEEGEVLIGAVGTVKPVKGQAVLVEAMVPLLREDPRVKLVLAGTAAGTYAEALARTAADAGVADRVLRPGPQGDVPGLLAALDLFVLPSLSEGMSNALLEAMAAGRAIVATAVGGNPECLEAGACGVLVAPGDAAALASAVRALLAEPARAAALGARAQERARSEYGLDRMLERTEALYAELLGVPR